MNYPENTAAILMAMGYDAIQDFSFHADGRLNWWREDIPCPTPEEVVEYARQQEESQP